VRSRFTLLDWNSKPSRIRSRPDNRAFETSETFDVEHDFWCDRRGADTFDASAVSRKIHDGAIVLAAALRNNSLPFNPISERFCLRFSRPLPGRADAIMRFFNQPGNTLQNGAMKLTAGQSRYVRPVRGEQKSCPSCIRLGLAAFRTSVVLQNAP